jgi:hypothetical protein
MINGYQVQGKEFPLEECEDWNFYPEPGYNLPTLDSNKFPEGTPEQTYTITLDGKPWSYRVVGTNFPKELFEAWIQNELYVLYEEELRQCYDSTGETWQEWRPVAGSAKLCYTKEQFESLLNLY